VSKAGKVGTIIFFLFSVGVVISALKLVGNIEEKRKEVDKLTVSLQAKETDLARVREEKTTLEKELETERDLKEQIQREMNLKIQGLLQKVAGEKEEKIAWKNKFEDLVETKNTLENKYREVQQLALNLQEMLKKSPPDVKTQVLKIPSSCSPSLLSKKIGGEVLIIAKPFLSLALDEKELAGLQPTLSIYRKGKLIKELATQGIRYATVVARVDAAEALKGIKNDDRVSLLLSPGTTEMFGSSSMEGKVLDIISPGFFNIDLGKEGLENIQPVLLVYREDALFKKIALRDIEHLTVVVEIVKGTSIKGIRKADIVKLIP